MLAPAAAGFRKALLKHALRLTTFHSSIEFIQRQLETWREGVHEVLRLRKIERFDGASDRPLRLREFLIACADLLQTLDVSAKLVRRLHQFPRLAVGVFGDEKRPVILFQGVGDHVEQLLRRRGFDFFIRGADLGIEVLDGRGKIAGQHLVGVVIQRQRGRSFRVHASVEQSVSNDGQRVSDHGDTQTMLLDVLWVGVMHQPPSPDELHPGEISEQVTHFEHSPYREWIGPRRRSSKSSRTAKPCRSYRLRLRGVGHRITASTAFFSQKRRQASISIDPRPAPRRDGSTYRLLMYPWVSASAPGFGIFSISCSQTAPTNLPASSTTQLRQWLPGVRREAIQARQRATKSVSASVAGSWPARNS